jgi:hypothetical protein
MDCWQTYGSRDDDRVKIGSLKTKGFQHQLWQSYGSRLASKWFKSHMGRDPLHLACVEDPVNTIDEAIAGLLKGSISGFFMAIAVLLWKLPEFDLGPLFTSANLPSRFPGLGDR